MKEHFYAYDFKRNEAHLYVSSLICLMKCLQVYSERSIDKSAIGWLSFRNVSKCDFLGDHFEFRKSSSTVELVLVLESEPSVHCVLFL